MSANTIEAWVSILWCRNWLPVSKIIWKRGSWCEVVEYSDWLDETLWTEWECQSVSYDSETTCVEENDNIYILRFSEIDWTFRVYDFSWTDVTWTVTPIKCASSEMFDIRSAWFYCIDWATTLERFDIIDLSNSTVSSSIWQDLTWVVVASPTGVITAWSCSVIQQAALSIGSEVLSITWITTLNATAWSMYAVVSVITGEIRVTVDGSTPTVGASHPVYEWQTIYLQIENEILDFQCTGVATLFVTYYDKPLLLSYQ